MTLTEVREIETDILCQLNDLIGERDELQQELHDLREALSVEIVEKGRLIKSLKSRCRKLQTLLLKARGMAPDEFREIERLLKGMFPLIALCSLLLIISGGV